MTTPCKDGTAIPSPEPRPTCGAKCRDGHACKTDKLLPNGRCRMHGGKSLIGFVHPNFRHGQYSRCILARFAGAVRVLREAGAVVETQADYQRVMRAIMPPVHRRRA